MKPRIMPTMYAEGYCDLTVIEEQPWGDMDFGKYERYLVTRRDAMHTWALNNSERKKEIQRKADTRYRGKRKSRVARV